MKMEKGLVAVPDIQLKNNWEETIQRFDAWLQHKNTGRPLMNLYAYRDPASPPYPKYTEEPFDDARDMFLNADKNFARLMNFYGWVEPLAEAFPQFSMNLGAGSLALYLGSEPLFAPDTLWFTHFIEEYDDCLPLRYDPDNVWWRKHLEIIRRQLELTRNTDIMVCIPDLIENIDILSAMRDPQTCCFDLYDYPDEVHEALQNISDVYMTYYDAIYDLVKKPDGVCAYTAFNILGTGKTAKIQCDFSALLSPEHFDEYILPSLKRQCEEIPNTMFHLDGPECLCHVDSLMSIEKLGCLQWTPGARNPKAGSEAWYELYTKVRNADKGLWIGLSDYEPEEAIAVADQLVKKFGPAGMYFHFPYMPRDMADALLIKAERDWKI